MAWLRTVCTSTQFNRHIATELFKTQTAATTAFVMYQVQGTEGQGNVF